MNITERLPLVVSLLFASGLMGWIVWTQRPADPVEVVEAPSMEAPPMEAPPMEAPPMEAPLPAPEPGPVDETRVADLRAAADRAPEDLQARIALGNLYFNALRFADAVPWYEAALALDPEAIDVSTDLGVAYFYLDDTDRALAQFARSLEVDPTDAKTMLNLGIVRAYGKQDLDGAIEVWEEAVRVAPDSPAGLLAADVLARFRAVH